MHVVLASVILENWDVFSLPKDKELFDLCLETGPVHVREASGGSVGKEGLYKNHNKSCVWPVRLTKHLCEYKTTHTIQDSTIQTLINKFLLRIVGESYAEGM